jgi:type III pantothenate kinase
MSFLAIDIGNTRLKWAQYASPQPHAALLAHGAVFLEAMDELAENDWKKLTPPSSLLGCVVAGEGVKRRAEEQLELWDLAPRWVVSSAHACGVTNGYEHPTRLGVDRWVALIGAWHRVLAHGRTASGARS